MSNPLLAKQESESKVRTRRPAGGTDSDARTVGDYNSRDAVMFLLKNIEK